MKAREKGIASITGHDFLEMLCKILSLMLIQDPDFFTTTFLVHR
jgi:hypothetical protein